MTILESETFYTFTLRQTENNRRATKISCLFTPPHQEPLFDFPPFTQSLPQVFLVCIPTNITFRYGFLINEDMSLMGETWSKTV